MSKIHTIERLCCGSTAFVVELQKPIKKNHIKYFLDSGYLIPDSYSNLGIFYAQKDKLIATCAFDRTSINVRCGGASCDDLIKEFANIADNIVLK